MEPANALDAWIVHCVKISMLTQTKHGTDSGHLYPFIFLSSYPLWRFAPWTTWFIIRKQHMGTERGDGFAIIVISDKLLAILAISLLSWSNPCSVSSKQRIVHTFHYQSCSSLIVYDPTVFWGTTAEASSVACKAVLNSCLEGVQVHLHWQWAVGAYS